VAAPAIASTLAPADLSRPALPSPTAPEVAATILAIPADAAVDDLWAVGSAYFKAQRMPEAAAHFWAAATKGDARGASALGAMYVRGQGVARDDKTGVFWLTKAANAGNRGAQFTLATLYDEGVGVAPDLERANQLYRASAEQRYAPAAKALAVNLELGRGTARDRQQAIVWMQQAAAEGDSEAPLFVTTLTQPDTPRFADEAALIAYVVQQAMANTGTSGGNFATGTRNPAAGQARSAGTAPAGAQGQVSQGQASQSQGGRTASATQKAARDKTSARQADARANAAAAALLQQSMGFGGIFGGMLGGGGANPWSFGGGGASGSGEKDCGRYSDYAACQAYRNGDIWAADRIQDDRADPAEKDWYNR
jgi:hypothetical protein